ncbi:putative transposase [Selenomonas ruminantium subsp. lactilytica TAM6421]|uniref:Putative transposase n=1 Tax=Selenomonas ruminantium subsp. lactilytica (strain NBRC 103574 / TAM6421) TaxID=927704 RepID=I0GQT3_SELRL|nr:transposase [Selenomonas ruminantium]BAL83120.1 putative transposase [Selenomonas ruminantium subsp. lactilytica TAM6421]
MSDSLYTIKEAYARYSLTDEAYEKIRECLPEEKTTGRPGMDVCLFLDALIFVVREGCSWRSIPATYGKSPIMNLIKYPEKGDYLCQIHYIQSRKHMQDTV